MLPFIRFSLVAKEYPSCADPEGISELPYRREAGVLLLVLHTEDRQDGHARLCGKVFAGPDVALACPSNPFTDTSVRYSNDTRTYDLIPSLRDLYFLVMVLAAGGRG